LLETAQEQAFARVRARLDGLSDDEFFWQPVADCWTIYQEPGGRWTYHYAEPEPRPAPVTTVGWQVVHLATCKVMYHEWAFGPARLSWPELDIPHSADAAIALLERGPRSACLGATVTRRRARGILVRPNFGDRLVQGRGHRESRRSRRFRPRPWGELWPAWRVFWTMIDHDALHGGAIGQLRDLYCWSRSWQPTTAR
jgi:hypothetical protein